MKPLGTQHIAEFLNCKKSLLNNPEQLEKLLMAGIKKSGLHYEKIISHKFNPLGVTVLAIISESHVGIHTYPEAGHISIDVFTCSDAKKQIKLIKHLKENLKPRKVIMTEIQRGNPLEIREPHWITSKSDCGFEVRYHVKKHLYKKKSKFQMIDIIENENFGKMLFLDKDLQISERDAHIYNEALVKPIKKSKRNIGNAAILGGGDGGILYEILKLNPENVTLVDIDEQVIKASKKHLSKICYEAFADPRVDVIAGDAIKFIESSKKFDAIVYDLTMHPEAFTKISRSLYLEDLFIKIKSRLNKKGIVTLQVGSEYDKETLKLAKRILRKHFINPKYQKIFIPSFCETWIFASARVQ
ncbi:MAG TPA: adenosylmethionine decarboxylase [Ignavibacteria bacterium]|nr:adenosylmethionine decarboxylase [Ignavibacteria bacterium]